MTQVFDLHCHSNRSDGILSPEQLVSRAKAQQVSCLALTDHDSVAGIAAARLQAEQEGIRLVAGIEFSSQWAGRGIHVVGLNINPEAESIVAAVAAQEKVRAQRAETIAARLARAGVDNALPGALARAGGGTIGRPHFAQYLVDEGHVTTINQAFKRYLGAGKPGDVKNLWPELETVVRWIVDAGGIAVLAHPAKYKLTRTKLCALASDFASVGGRAMELVSGKQPVGLAENLAKIASSYQLAGSCGSDFHVPGQPWQELGCFSSLPVGALPVWELWQTR